jgi:membrane protein
MKKFSSSILAMLNETYRGYYRANGPLLAAALAYYTIFSLTPLLGIAIGVAGLIFTEAAVTDKLVREISLFVSPDVAQVIEAWITNSNNLQQKALTTAFSAVVTLAAASIMFSSLKRSIDFMWGIAPPPSQGWLHTLRTHFLSFGMVLITGLLLLVFMVMSTLIISVNQWLSFLPIQTQELLPRADFGLMFVGFALLFAIIFKILPDAEVRWRDIWLGAAVTAVAFTVGSFLIGYYLGNFAFRGSFGIASSLFIILIWIFYSMQIILLGAKFTQAYANRFGGRILPRKKAVWVIQEWNPPEN